MPAFQSARLVCSRSTLDRELPSRACHIKSFHEEVDSVGTRCQEANIQLGLLVMRKVFGAESFGQVLDASIRLSSSIETRALLVTMQIIIVTRSNRGHRTATTQYLTETLPNKFDSFAKFNKVNPGAALYGSIDLLDVENYMHYTRATFTAHRILQHYVFKRSAR